MSVRMILPRVLEFERVKGDDFVDRLQKERVKGRQRNKERG